MKKKGYVEMRYYDVPQKEWVLALIGKPWVRAYGDGVDYLHFHNLYELGICRKGTGELVLDKNVRPFRPDMISVIPSGYPHTTNSTKGTLGFWEYLFFDPRMILEKYYGDDQVKIARCMSALGKGAVFGDISDYRELAQLANLIMEEMRNHRDFYIERVHALVTALIFEMLRISGSGSESIFRQDRGAVLQNALKYIDQHYADPIRIEDLARECSISETHFRRLFSESFDVSPAEYLNMIRVLKACDIMKKSDDQMPSVAMKCGFQTVSTLDRNFKNVLGVTPYQWKKDPKNYESRMLEVNVSVKKGW